MKATSNLIEDVGDERAIRSRGRREPHRGLRAALLKHRSPICRSILEAMRNTPRFSSVPASTCEEEDAFALRTFRVFVDCVALYFGTRDPTYRDILIGELVKLAHVPREDLEALTAARRHAADAVIDPMIAHCRPDLDADEREALESFLDSIGLAVKTPTSRRVDLLFVGDCLMFELTSFLAGPLLELGIEVNTSYVSSRNPAEVEGMIRGHSGRRWTAAVFSPFTYEFAEHFSRSLKAPHVIARPHAVRDMVEPSMELIDRHLELLASELDCPIFVHNASNIRRHNGTAADAVKIAASWRTRRAVREEANRRIAVSIAKVNAATFPHVHLFDEHALLRRSSEWTLGARYYDSEDQHPTVLSRTMAAEYRDRLEMLVSLSTRKLVVCDLDNTLWEGEIGEGAVRHHAERQAILRRLREKGVLLAINSRNDPRNVHWRGAVLDERDFVASEINWDAKSTNMSRIQRKLNLKTRDFVFLDDRADQREIVSSTYPEIHAMDALSERTWKLLDLWAAVIQPGDDGDRTQLYREREEREKFLTADDAAADTTSFMSKLGLKATFRSAGRGDLKRVVELINRTNQFNLNGSRTTFREAAAWITHPDHRILVIDGADKFGQMGLICVAFVEMTPAAVRIPTFVLSCRVFGYGFETAMLNAVHRLGRSSAGGAVPRPIVGLYQETPLNGPCRSMYPDHGFVPAEGGWIHDGATIPADPAWLELHDLVTA